MNNSDFSEVFSELSVLGRSVEEKMYEFLLKDIHSDFIDLVKWQTKTGGKRLRPALTLLFARAFGASSNDLESRSAAAGIELIHTYSLILDDIIDRGDLRRGEKTTRAKFGDKFAILAAIIYREAIYDAAKATGENFTNTIDVYSKTIRHLTEGERLDILFEQKEDIENEYFQSNRYTDVTLEDYLEMIRGKTAALLAAACKLGAMVAGASLDEQNCAENYGWAAGIAFQIADDYLDIFSTADTFGKVIFKDIIEQKLGNFVIVQALRLLDSTDAQILKDCLTDQKISDEERISKCNPLIEKSNVKEFVMNEAQKWANEAKMNIAKLEFRDKSMHELLEQVADFSVKRAF
ncbi:polyprenyl synthetase [Candidatus Heimdallarchaeota archaeon B3_Heim]|nr:MAG: polyprenyl synthetase [Candidatus Heimdallarchaeota archaeon B3_Heim]